jgi:hypothetical protein
MVTSISKHYSLLFPIGRRIRGLTLLAAGLAATAGCSDSEPQLLAVHPVSGAIQFRGQPMGGAFITLHANGASADSPLPRASVQPDGSFALTTYNGHDGAPAGEYVLTVHWYKPVKHGDDWVGGPNVLPSKYASPRTSGLLVTVAEGENHLQPIQLR